MGKTADLNYTIDLNEASNGGHTLYVRSIDENGKTSFIQRQSFWKDAVSVNQTANLKRIEYFIDSDPGINSGHVIPFTVGKTADLNYTIDLNEASNGGHTLYVRSIDENGKSSFIQRQSFWKSDAYQGGAKIVQIDYFIDSETNVQSLYLQNEKQAPYVDTNLSVDMTGLSGKHNVYVRAKDNRGNWSFTQYQSLCVEPQVDFYTDRAFYIQDDTIRFYVNVSSNQTYKCEWDFNNNANYTEMSGNNIWYKYHFMGDYQVNLRVTLADGCSTTVSKTVMVNLNTLNNRIIEPTAEITVFPNPSDGKFRIKAENLNPNSIMQILSVDGKVIYSDILNPNKQIFEVNISTKPKGVYFLKIMNDKQITIKQLIKK